MAHSSKIAAQEKTGEAQSLSSCLRLRFFFFALPFWSTAPICKCPSRTKRKRKAISKTRSWMAPTHEASHCITAHGRRIITPQYGKPGCNNYLACCMKHQKAWGHAATKPRARDVAIILHTKQRDHFPCARQFEGWRGLVSATNLAYTRWVKQANKQIWRPFEARVARSLEGYATIVKFWHPDTKEATFELVRNGSQWMV